MDIRAGLNELVGKKALVKIRGLEVGAIIESIRPPLDLLSVGGEQDFQNAIARSEFSVRFVDFIVDGSDRRTVSGFYISAFRSATE